MKIGIITYWQDKSNYGQILQMFALQQFLKNNEHEPFLVRYKEEPIAQAHFRMSNLMNYFVKFPQYVKWFLNARKQKQKIERYQQKESEHNRHFDAFIKSHISCSESVYSEEQLLQAPPMADAYFCGSDQIWGGKLPYYLNFAPNNKKKIAWAPSFGGITKWDRTYEEQIAGLISRFDFLGVREQSGVEVCHRLGRTDAVKVIDPTLLLTQQDYDRIREKIESEKPYAFVYLLKNTISCGLDEIFSYIKSLGLDVKFVNNTEIGDEYAPVYPTVGEWVDMLASASLVITNSFHATVFSLLYERPFITIPLAGIYSRMNGRIEELLAESHLKDRIYQGNFRKMNEQVDFSYFREYHLSEQEKSFIYLNPIIGLKHD